MARYRKIDVRIWGDNKFRALTPIPACGQGLWFYLLTGRETGIVPGLIVGGRATMAESLGWTAEGFAKAFAEVFLQGLAKADWEARLVWVPNAIRYNAPANPNVVKSWREAWDETPECALKHEAWRAIKPFVEGLGEGFAKAFREALPEPSSKGLANQEQEQEQEQEEAFVPEAKASEPLDRVLDVWRKVCEPVGFAKARATAQRRKKAATRMREAGWFDAFEVACAYAAREPFYRGASKSGWVMDLGWLLEPGNAEKTAERAGTRKANGRNADPEVVRALAEAERDASNAGPRQPDALDERGDGGSEPLGPTPDDVASNAASLSAALGARLADRRSAGKLQDAANAEPGARHGDAPPARAARDARAERG